VEKVEGLLVRKREGGEGEKRGEGGEGGKRREGGEGGEVERVSRS
jgi:hypothetical protein